MKRGLVIGKFYPPHLGHKFLIDRATANTDHVDVIVCVRPDQEISGALRSGWIREMCPAASVVEVDDICDDDNSQRWAMYVKEVLGSAPDVVFTSEEYGESFARHLGCEHVMVDVARRKVPVSGTAVRNDPFQHWQFLAPCVRAYYVKRICVVGAESTGTTTMARALAEYFRTSWVPEFGREYAEAKLLTIDESHIPTYEWRSEEFEHIALAQIDREDRMAREANCVLICDTDPIATSVWHERYMGFESAEVEKLASTRNYDLYLLTDCDIPFKQDGTRDGELLRQWMTERLSEKLRIRGARWLKLSGTHAERMEKAVAAIESCLK